MLALIELISIAAKIYSLLIIGRVILSWVNSDPYNPVVRFVVRVTEPVMAPVRNLLPTFGGLDFSPIVVLIGIQIAENLLIRAIIGLAM